MTYYDGLHQLIRVEEEKDLGVLLSSTLKFSHYVKEIVHKANRLLAGLPHSKLSRIRASGEAIFLFVGKQSVGSLCLLVV